MKKLTTLKIQKSCLVLVLMAAMTLAFFFNEVDSIAVHQKFNRPTRFVPYDDDPSSQSQPSVQIISKNTWREMGMKPMPSSYYRKKASKKVDTQKFRQCIFFQLCEKSECFHYGRFGKCS